MKRTPLKRTTPLAQMSTLTRKVPPQRTSATLRRAPLRPGVSLRPGRKRRSEEPGEAAWKMPHRGKCSVCRKPGPLVRHHVVKEQHVRKHGGDPWDMRNAMEVGMWCDCHEQHHTYGVNKRSFRIDQLPASAVAFAHQLLGDYAEDYLRRHYQAPLTNTQHKEG